MIKMGSIMETHLDYVEELKARGEIVLQPRVGKPMCSIEGYIKTQIPYRDAGSIFEDKNGKFGLHNDMGMLYVTGIEWCDLGLCDSRCWYEWMDPEPPEEEKPDKAYLGNATIRELLDEIRARIEIDGRLDYRTVDIE